MERNSRILKTKLALGLLFLLSSTLLLFHGCSSFPGLSVRIDTTVESPTSLIHQINLSATGPVVSLLKPYEEEIRDLIEVVAAEGWEIQNSELTEDACDIKMRRGFGDTIVLNVFSHHLETNDVGEEREFCLTITIPEARFQPEIQKDIDSLLPVAEKIPMKPVTWTVSMPGEIVETNGADSVKDGQAIWRLSITELMNGGQLCATSRVTISPSAIEEPPSPRTSSLCIVVLATGLGLVSAAAGFLLFRFVPPWLRRRRASLAETREDYERKLAQWEKEGYDVQELKDKWFESQD